MSNLCAVCNKNADKTCANCSHAYYCTKEHQMQDWKNHKTHCAPFKVKTDDILGRYLVTTRDINAGEIILKQKPLILGPKTVSVPLCLGCHKRLNLETNTRFECSKCLWPLCSKECEKSSLHKEECDVFARANYEPSVNNDNSKQSIYSVITPLRALLLKKSQPNKFDVLLNCQSHLEEHLATPVYQILKLNLGSFFLDLLKLNTSEAEIMTICSIFDTNCFEVRDTQGFVNVRGLYPTISLLSHDCQHNTKHSFHGEDFQLVLTATIPIKKGDSITTTYTQTLWGTPKRRAHLKMSKHFACLCDRCKDPTEFGTYAGAICCNQCDEGAKIISCDPLNDEADWKCESCGNIIQGEEFILGNNILRKEISQLDKTDPKNLEFFLAKYEGVLHKTNSYALEVKYALTQMYGNMERYKLKDISIELLNRKIELCQELLDIGNILEPGLSRFRGLLLNDLQEAIKVKAKRDFCNKNIDQREFENCINQAEHYLQEASAILKSEPDFHELIKRS